MAIDLYFSEDQIERLVQAAETAAYSYCYSSGYLSHAEQLAKQEKEDNPLITGSYALGTTFPESVKQVEEMDEESLTKLLRSVMTAAKESGVYDRYLDEHIKQQMHFDKELNKK